MAAHMCAPIVGRANTQTIAATVTVVEVATINVAQQSAAPIMSPIIAPHIGILSGRTVSGPTNICNLQPVATTSTSVSFSDAYGWGGGILRTPSTPTPNQRIGRTNGSLLPQFEAS